MKKIRRALALPFWRLWSLLERHYRMTSDRQKRGFIVLGFPRSGTSLVSRLVHACGVSFGDQKKFKPADRRNPKGFYEYAESIRLDEKLSKQAGFGSPYSFDDTTNIRAKGWMNKIRRTASRMKMLRILKDISASGETWAIKEFPSTLYFWEPYVKNAKVIGVFRHPLSNAYSVRTAFGRHTFRQIVEQWTAANKELIYHLSTKESMLIQLEDLMDEGKKDAILKKLVAFIGGGDVATLRRAIEPFVSESSKHMRALEDHYPLDIETLQVLEALQKMKDS